MAVKSIDYKSLGRSTLKSEPPIAFGTALVESVDGYMERLVATHDTMRSSLDRVVFGRGPPLPYSVRYQDQFLADAPSEIGRAFCKNLSELTRQPQVARLGLGWMRDVIAQTDAVKPFKAWCTECCRDSYQGRRENYWPLLWSIAGVTACPVHQTVLADRCGSCESRVSGRRGPLYPFHLCPRCHCLLHAGRTAMAAKSLSKASLEQLAVAELVGDMLAAISGLSTSQALELPSLRKATESAIRRGLVRGMNEFLVRAKLSRSTYSCLINGGRVSLRIAIRVAMAADIGLAGLYCPQLWSESTARSATPCVPAPRPRRILSTEQLREAAEKEIRSGNACSLYRFCKKLQVDRKVVKRHLGSTVDLLASAALEAKAKRRKSSETAMAKAIAQELARMRASGMRPSARALARAVKCPRHRLDFIAGLQIAMPDVEIRYGRFTARKVA